MTNCHVSITGRDRRHLAALAPKLRIVVVDYREDKHGATVDAYVRGDKIGWLRRQGYAVTLLEKVDGHDRSRQKEERRSVARRVKQGRYGEVLWAGGYLTADEVERAMVIGEKNHAGYFERIPLPHLTWEGRRVHAFRIGAGDGGDTSKPAVCFLGGVHGREWGSPDILIYFAVRLLRAYRDGHGFKLGRHEITPAQVRGLVKNVDIIVLPQVNPDGRKFSMERSAMWRKNRRPAPRGHGTRSVGVDINRNFPFLWRFRRYFATGTVDSSSRPGDYESYIGPREASEPETRNVIWLLDRFPNIRYMVDLHSYGEAILHSWGSDENQSNDPRMNFQNRAYDGKRGKLHDDAYREYFPPDDRKAALAIARRMAAAIRVVRGRRYQVKPSVGLYPTAGATDDYSYSRHFVDPRKGKIIPLTVEWGRSHASTPFHPPYPEMRKVMREVSAGLLAVCMSARTRGRNGR
jgi:murein tripeptide amidase MpaA